jgi:hypothetical protein
MTKRTSKGRALFYSRDSGGQHEMTPGAYVGWAQATATQHGVAFGGGRDYDMDCGWPMYRQPYGDTFRYLCGYYQQSHGVACRHNHVDGPSATRFLLATIRQRVLTAPMRTRLEEKLRRLALAEARAHTAGDLATEKRSRLEETGRKLERVTTNMALAQTDAQFQAISQVYEQLRGERDVLEGELRAATDRSRERTDPEVVVAAALGLLDRLADLADRPSNLSGIGELFAALNVRLFLRFRVEECGKRDVNRIAGGVVTFGGTPPPVTLYEGPTSRRRVQALVTSLDSKPRDARSQLESQVPGGEEDSLGNVNRGERI